VLRLNPRFCLFSKKALQASMPETLDHDALYRYEIQMSSSLDAQTDINGFQ
jgi:hypothetical protein